MKLTRIVMAGAGGQGIIFLGKLLANAAVDAIPHVTYFPSYGAEVRGGNSHCQVILSPDEISSPVAEEFEAMILMNQQSVDKFLPCLEGKGLAVINSSLCNPGGKPGHAGRTLDPPALRQTRRHREVPAKIHGGRQDHLGTQFGRLSFLHVLPTVNPSFSLSGNTLFSHTPAHD